MPSPDTNTPITKRTVEDIEAELQSLDSAAREQQLAEDDAPAAPATSTPVHNYEQEAQRKGWKPKDAYTGPEGSWVDAKTFIERGERFTKNLEHEIAVLRAKVEGFEGTKAQFRKFFDEQMAKRDKEHADAIAALRIQRSQAIREGDDELAIQLEDRIDETKAQQASLAAEAKQLEVEKTTPATAAPQPDSPVLIEWMEDGNDWFKKDEVLTKHAIAVGEQFRKDGDKSIGRAFLDRVAAQVRSDFPRRFKAQPAAGARPATTESASQGNTGTAKTPGYNGQTERDLPAEDLAIMRQFVKEGLYTKEQFLKSYFSRNG